MKRKSENVKTGDMAQVSTVVQDRSPAKAIKDKIDKIVCGTCPFQEGGMCYVNPVTEILGWEATKDLDKVDPPQHKKGVRFGKYGDPALIPISIIQKTIDAGSGDWVGYTHQWMTISRSYARYFMASIDHLMAKQVGMTVLQLKELAQSFGYRTYRVLLPGEKNQKDEISCPYPKVQCKDCLLCAGTTPSKGLKNITQPVHGSPNAIKMYKEKAK